MTLYDTDIFLKIAITNSKPISMKYLLLLAIQFLTVFSSLAFRVSDLTDINGNENQITEIDFSNKGLVEFPTEILNCKNLVSLDLSNNGIISIPNGLSSLVNLKNLNLSHNKTLSPADLELVFDQSKFKLSNLNLSGCKLLYLPASISNQTDLQVLDLSSNRLNALPYGMMSFSKLERINLSSNFLQNLSWIVSYWWSLKSIDFSHNEGIQASGVLLSLSYFDHLEEVTFSKLDFFPEDFALMNVDQLTIKNSFIDAFPRSGVSTQIKKLQFENCKFAKTLSLVNIINEFVKPEFVYFSRSDPQNLIEFLKLEADSVTLFELGSVDLRPLKKNESLKWLDVRGNQLDKTHITEFINERPDVELLYKEPIRPDFGICPPLPQFVSQPTLKTIQAGTNQVVEFGKSLFEFPAQGILDVSGNIYTGPVNLAYREFTNPAEILLSGITMTSESENGETMMFSSAGMFELTASDDKGNELFINPEQPVNAEMFTWIANPEMEMYALNDEGSWTKTMDDSLIQSYQFNDLKQDSVMTEDFMSKSNAQVVFGFDRYVPIVKKNRKSGTFEITLREYKTWGNHKGVTPGYGSTSVFNPDLTAKFLTNQRFVFEGAEAQKMFDKVDSISNYCDKKYRRLKLDRFKNNLYSQMGPNYISQINLMPDFERDCFILSFRFKKEKIRIPVSLVSDETGSVASLKQNRVFFGLYTNAWKKTKKIENTNQRQLKKHITKKVNTLKQKAQEERIKALKINYLDKSYFNKPRLGSNIRSSLGFAFQILSFGIHNSDSRARIPRPVEFSSEFVTAAADKIKDKPDEIYVIDHNINGVIQYDESDKLMFNRLSATSLVVFFTSGMVGIYNSWRNMRTNKYTQLELVNPLEMTRENFIKRICYER